MKSPNPTSNIRALSFFLRLGRDPHPLVRIDMGRKRCFMLGCGLDNPLCETIDISLFGKDPFSSHHKLC